MKTTRTAKDIKIANLSSDLETLLNRYNAVPNRSNLGRVKAVREELAEVRTQG